MPGHKYSLGVLGVVGVDRHCKGLSGGRNPLWCLMSVVLKE